MDHLGNDGGGATAPPVPHDSRRLRALRRCAALACLCWVLIVLLLWTQHRLRAVHFRFLPFALLVLAMAAAAVVTQAVAIRAWRRGAGARAVLPWLVLGLLPLVLFAAPCVYAARLAARACFPTDPAFLFATGAAMSSMEGAVR